MLTARYKWPYQLANGLWVVTEMVSCGTGLAACMTFDCGSSVDIRSCGAVEINYCGEARLIVTDNPDKDVFEPGLADGYAYFGDARVVWAGKGSPTQGCCRVTFADHTEIERQPPGGVRVLYWGEGTIGVEQAIPEGL